MRSPLPSGRTSAGFGRAPRRRRHGFTVTRRKTVCRARAGAQGDLQIAFAPAFTICGSRRVHSTILIRKADGNRTGGRRRISGGCHEPAKRTIVGGRAGAHDGSGGYPRGTEVLLKKAKVDIGVPGKVLEGSAGDRGRARAGPARQREKLLASATASTLRLLVNRTLRAQAPRPDVHVPQRAGDGRPGAGLDECSSGSKGWTRKRRGSPAKSCWCGRRQPLSRGWH